MTFTRPLSRTLLLALAALLVYPASLAAQSSSSSSSSSTGDSSSSGPAQTPAPALPRISQPEAGGSAVTLETSEPLFYLAASLNACGYDSGLDNSAPVRQKIRDEINEELTASAPARDSRDALCAYIRQHALTDSGRSLAQYVSLSLFLSPPPTLTPSADISELPPDAAAVADVLPLVRTFAEQVHLNALWVEHRAEYETLVASIHDPLTTMVLSTNVYLHLPVSSYDGRRFLVLLEPMLAPSETNARIYGSDFAVVVSPDAHAPANTVPVPMDLIRHTYLHFDVEPLIYSRAQEMNPLLPLLRTVQSAPIDFSYKSDIVSLVNECLIKAIEIRTMDVGIPQPPRPNTRERSEQEHYDIALSAWERQAESVRRRNVDLAMRHGWILAGYFYDQLGIMQHNGTSLRDEIGPMVFGMEVGNEVNHAKQIVFLPDTSSEVVRRVAPRPAGLDLAELKLMKGDTDGAEEMADATLKTDPKNAQAHYLLGRIDLMEGDPDEALAELTQTIALSKDPRTTAWAHIYLGRMYDIARDPDDPNAHPQREKAVAEYRAALANRDSQPDTKAAAEKGIKEPFALPKRQTTDDPADDNAPLDPTGKAEKDSYRPPPPLPPQH